MAATEGGVAIPEAMERSGATWRQVHHWISRGWLKSSRGDQWAHILSPEEVDVARVMVHLINAGMTPFKAATIAREVQAGGGRPVDLGEGVFITFTGEKVPGAEGA